MLVVVLNRKVHAVVNFLPAKISSKYLEVGTTLQPAYINLPVDDLKLDIENPRIAKAIEYYGEDIGAEAMALALKGSSDEAGTSFASLRDSIKAYGGIISPIIVNRNGACEKHAQIP